MPAVVMASHPKRHVACIAAICDNSDDPAADRHHCEIHGCRYVDRLSQDRRPHQLYEVVEGVKPHQRAAEAAWWHVVQIGSASCRERVCQCVEIPGVAVSLK